MKASEYDWLSAADFRLGHRAQLVGDLHRARMFYARVIGRQPEHVAARHNAAVVEIRAGRPDVAISHLEVLERLLDHEHRQREKETRARRARRAVLEWIRVRTPGGRERPRRARPADSLADEALHCSLLYNQALAHATLAGERPADFKRALGYTGPLIQRLLKRLNERDATSRARRGRTRAAGEPDVLNRLTPSAAVFHASMLIESGVASWEYAVKEATNKSSGPIEPSELAEKLVDPDSWPPLAARYAADADPRARYNVACYLARLQRHSEWSGESELTRRARTHLRHALQDGELLAWADHDPALEPVKDAHPGLWNAMLSELGADPSDEPKAPEKAAPEADSTIDEPAPPRLRFELVVAIERYTWLLVGDGDERLAVATENFPSGPAALRAARDVQDHAGGAAIGTEIRRVPGWRFVFAPGRGGSHTWTLRDAAGRPAARAPGEYPTLSAAAADAETIRDHVHSAAIPELSAE